MTRSFHAPIADPAEVRAERRPGVRRGRGGRQRFLRRPILILWAAAVVQRLILLEVVVGESLPLW